MHVSALQNKHYYSYKLQILQYNIYAIFTVQEICIAILFETPYRRFIQYAVAHGIQIHNATDTKKTSLRDNTILRYLQQYTQSPACPIPEEIYTSVAMCNATDFQKSVWSTLLHTTPCGSVTTYKTIAQALGKGCACRAVGNAVGKNPFSIVVPCHRVVLQRHYNSKNRKATGVKNYSAGIFIKQALLYHEKGLLKL